MAIGRSNINKTTRLSNLVPMYGMKQKSYNDLSLYVRENDKYISVDGDSASIISPVEEAGFRKLSIAINNHARSYPSKDKIFKQGQILPEKKDSAFSAGKTISTIVTAGGKIDGVLSLSAFKFNGDTWSADVNINESHAECACIGNNYYSSLAIGGYKNASTLSANVSSFNGTAWSTLSATLLTARRRFSACGRSKFFMIHGGGTNATSLSTKVNSTELYNSVAFSVSNNLNKTRLDHCSLGLSTNFMRVIGGMVYSDTEVTDDSSEIFNGVSWSKIEGYSSNSSDNRRGAAALGAVFGGVVTGGFSRQSTSPGYNDTYKTCSFYEANTKTTTLERVSLLENKAYHMIAGSIRNFALIGGQDTSGNSTNSCQIYIPTEISEYNLFREIDTKKVIIDNTLSDTPQWKVSNAVSNIYRSTGDITGSEGMSIVTGGFTTSNTTIPTSDDTEIFDGIIYRLVQTSPIPRIESSVVGPSTNDVLSIGGFEDDNAYNGFVFKYNGDIWKTITELNVGRGGKSAIASSSNNALIYGGLDWINNMPIKSGEQFNGTAWTTRSEESLIETAIADAAGTPSLFMMIGGWDLDFTSTSNVQVLNNITWSMYPSINYIRAWPGAGGNVNDCIVFDDLELGDGALIAEKFDGVAWKILDKKKNISGSDTSYAASSSYGMSISGVYQTSLEATNNVLVTRAVTELFKKCKNTDNIITQRTYISAKSNVSKPLVSSDLISTIDMMPIWKVDNRDTSGAYGTSSIIFGSSSSYTMANTNKNVYDVDQITHTVNVNPFSISALCSIGSYKYGLGFTKVGDYNLSAILYDGVTWQIHSIVPITDTATQYPGGIQDSITSTGFVNDGFIIKNKNVSDGGNTPKEALYFNGNAWALTVSPSNCYYSSILGGKSIINSVLVDAVEGFRLISNKAHPGSQLFDGVTWISIGDVNIPRTRLGVAGSTLNLNIIGGSINLFNDTSYTSADLNTEIFNGKTFFIGSNINMSRQNWPTADGTSGVNCVLTGGAKSTSSSYKNEISFNPLDYYDNLTSSSNLELFSSSKIINRNNRLELIKYDIESDSITIENNLNLIHPNFVLQDIYGTIATDTTKDDNVGFWYTLPFSMWDMNTESAAAGNGNRVLVIGGKTGSSTNKSYLFDKIKYTTMTAYPISVSSHAACGTDNVMSFTGGYSSSYYVHHYISSISSGSLVLSRSYDLPTARSRHTMFGLAGNFMVVGGYNGSPLNTTYKGSDTSFTTGPNYIYMTYWLRSCGSPNSGLLTGGFSVDSPSCVIFNGTTFSVLSGLLTANNRILHGLSGRSNYAIMFGGSTTNGSGISLGNTEEFDGVTWKNITQMNSGIAAFGFNNTFTSQTVTMSGALNGIAENDPTYPGYNQAFNHNRLPLDMKLSISNDTVDINKGTIFDLNIIPKRNEFWVLDSNIVPSNNWGTTPPLCFGLGDATITIAVGTAYANNSYTWSTMSAKPNVRRDWGSAIGYLNDAMLINGTGGANSAEKWDGETFSTISALTSRNRCGGSASGHSNYRGAIIAGGNISTVINNANPSNSTDTVEKWNGSTWSEFTKLNVARLRCRSTQTSNIGGYMVIGGSLKELYEVPNTEKYDDASSAWKSGPKPIIGSYDFACCGDKMAHHLLALGGYKSCAKFNNESYYIAPNMLISRDNVGGTGNINNCIVIGIRDNYAIMEPNVPVPGEKFFSSNIVDNTSLNIYNSFNFVEFYAYKDK